METMKAEYHTDIARLAEDMARRDVEGGDIAARHDKDTLRWIVGLFIAAIVMIPALSNSAAIANLFTLPGS